MYKVNDPILNINDFTILTISTNKVYFIQFNTTSIPKCCTILGNISDINWNTILIIAKVSPFLKVNLLVTGISLTISLLEHYFRENPK